MKSIKINRKNVYIVFAFIFLSANITAFSQVPNVPNVPKTVKVPKAPKISKFNKGSHNYIVSTRNGAKNYFVNNTILSNFSIEYDGKITVSDDDSDIIAISNGGYIEIKKSSFGRKRRIVIDSEGGKLTKRYYVGWSKKDFYPEGKKWLAEILPEIVRTTVIAADTRVERFYKKGGAKAVLHEIKRIKSDFVQSKYFKLLLERNLSTKELISLIKTAGNQLSSDFYLSQVLTKNQQKFLQNDQTITAYINAAKNIGSDFYITEVVKKVIKDKKISDSQLGALLEIGEEVGSDHYLTIILKGIMDNRELNKQNMDKVLKIAQHIGSDHYKTQILKKAIQSKNMSQSSYQSFMSIMNGVSSDHYLTEIIKELLKKSLSEASLNNILKIMDDNISSDHYATLLYKKMSRQNNITENQIIAILNNASKVLNSSYYLSETLLAFSKKVRNGSSKLKDTYTKVAKNINSDTYFGKAMKAIY